MAAVAGLLNPAPILTSLLGAILSYVAVGAVINYRKLPQFKGPPFAGFSRIWHFWQAVNARVNKAEFEALQKYGIY